MSQPNDVPLDGGIDETKTVSLPLEDETVIAAYWGEAGLSCAGCGQAAVAIDRSAAVDEVRDLPRRFATLFDHSDRELRRRVDGDGWSALESVEHASGVLNAADKYLGQFTGADDEPRHAVMVRVEVVPPGSNGMATMKVLAELSANAASLTRTINETTDEDWRHRSASDDGASCAQVVWVAIHNALHHFEDAELALGVTRPDGGVTPEAMAEGAVVRPVLRGAAGPTTENLSSTRIGLPAVVDG